jgi:hypothetical protein
MLEEARLLPGFLFWKINFTTESRSAQRGGYYFLCVLCVSVVTFLF